MPLSITTVPEVEGRPRPYEDGMDDGALTPVLRWRPDRTAVPMEIAQSRDWHGEDEAL
jgi:hypothetical protein